MKGKGKSFLALIVFFVLGGLVVFGLTNGYRAINENNNTQRKADISLNTYVDSGEEFPVGKYVSLEVRWVIGPFGTYTTTSTSHGMTATSNVDYWYVAVLEDGTFMAVSTRNTAEREKLDRMSDWLLGVEGFPRNGETFTLQGKLKKLTNKDMKGIYEKFMTQAGVSLTDSRIRYLVLDTSAGREQLWIIIIAAAALIVIGLVAFSKIRKKKAEERAAEPENPYAMPYGTNETDETKRK